MLQMYHLFFMGQYSWEQKKHKAIHQANSVMKNKRGGNPTNYDNSVQNQTFPDNQLTDWLELETNIKQKG